jgi:AAA family ATP:ADP antiporter
VTAGRPCVVTVEGGEVTPPDDTSTAAARGPFDRLLGLFTDVHAGEGVPAALMLLNIFLILVSYYIIKTVREPLILAATVPDWLQSRGVGPAEVTAYATAGQALALMAFVPAYSWFASRVDRMKLVFGVTAFFAANILLFALAVQAGVRFIGVFFYIWVGLFSLSIIAQFWSYANDIYTKDAGDRLFPIIGVGMTAGTPVGAWIAGRMFTAHLRPHLMLYLAAVLLLTTMGIYAMTNRGRSGSRHAAVAKAPIGGKGAFSLVFASRYIGLIVVLLILLNVVNTVGEYLLRQLVVAHAADALQADPAFDQNAYIGGFYGSYLFWVSIGSVVLQALVAPRLVKRFGLAGVLFALPFIALGAYGVVALGATIAVVRWAKTAENSTDYSIMNTARQLLWLPTTREEKYKAKQAADTFFVRLGDLMAGFVVFVGTSWLALGVRGFAALNIVVVIVWLGVGILVVRENRRLSAAQPVGRP